MYKINKIKVNKNTTKYQFIDQFWREDENRKITYAEFINLLKAKNKNFFRAFREALEDGNNELKAYFWECPPVSRATKNSQPFEFVITESKALDSINQNYLSFSEYFTKGLNDDAVSFLSLGKDAKLVVPAPTKSSNLINNNEERFDYKNISQFTKNAPLEKQYNFWHKVANELEKSLDSSNETTLKWLSTSGLSIHYLHVRIDSRPKYYSWSEYLSVENLKEDRQLGKSNKNYLETTDFSSYGNSARIETTQRKHDYDYRAIIEKINQHRNDWEIREIPTSRGSYYSDNLKTVLIHKSFKEKYNKSGDLIVDRERMYFEEEFSKRDWTKIKQQTIAPQNSFLNQESKSIGNYHHTSTNQTVRWGLISRINQWKNEFKIEKIFVLNENNDYSEEEWIIHDSVERKNDKNGSLVFDSEKMFKVKDLSEAEKTELGIQQLKDKACQTLTQSDRCGKGGLFNNPFVWGSGVVISLIGLVFTTKK